MFWCEHFPRYFTHSGNRKSRYSSFLLENEAESRLSPTPCQVRWGYFFQCFDYHDKFLVRENEFLEKESDLLDDGAPDILKELLVNLILIRVRIVRCIERIHP